MKRVEQEIEWEPTPLDRAAEWLAPEVHGHSQSETNVARCERP